MHRLLADESLHIEPQLVVFDQWQRLLEQVDEELLAGRQQQVQHVEHVGSERLTGHVVKRQVRPVERDVARFEDQSFVIAQRPGTWQVRTDTLLVDREHWQEHTRYPRYRELLAVRRARLPAGARRSAMSGCPQ